MLHLLAFQTDSTYNTSYMIGRVVGFLIIAIIVLVVLKAVFKKR